ncbi:MAG: adenylosuccinate lyase [Gammaproteobacteria bacterium]|nr:adenylosuccinate lyase [Gammaproteobacteria bacterium]
MELSPLTALSPVDGRYHKTTNTRLRQLFSEFGLIHHRLEVEVVWLLALSDHPGIPEIPSLSDAAKERLQSLVAGFSPEQAQQVKDIEKETNHDVKALEYFLRGKLKEDPDLGVLEGFIHFACTSWDVNHPAYALMLDRARTEVVLPALERLEQNIQSMAHEYADVPMLSRTHGQPASPTTVGKELAVTVARLRRQLEPLRSMRFLGKMNGAIGNYNAHLAAYPEVDWTDLSEKVLDSLGLDPNPYTTQIEPYDQFAEFFHCLIRINNLLTDFAQDVWQYISLGYFRQKAKAGEVGSSTMPHKVNPIDFENAEGNLGLACAELDYYANKLPISRLQRDLSDSTVLRNMGATLACSTNAYAALERGLGKLDVDTERLDDDLEACPEVLAEAVQTVMKRYGLPDPYEQLKAFTRGQRITRENLAEFISGLDLPDDAKQRLSAMTPRDYIGAAAELARRI